MNMTDEDIKRIFVAHRAEFVDAGFTEGVKNRMPQRPNYIPQIVMFACSIIGLVIVVWIQGFEPLMHNMSDLFVSLSRMQMPSFASMATFLGMLASVCIVGFSVESVE